MPALSPGVRWPATGKMPTHAHRPPTSRVAGVAVRRGAPVAVGRRRARSTRTPVGTWCTRPAACCPCTPSAARRSFPPTGSPGPRPGSPTTTGLTATPTCGSCSSRRPSPGSYPPIPPCSPRPDLARELLLALTGPRSYDPAERTLDHGARARLRRVLVDELHEAPEQPLHLPEPTRRPAARRRAGCCASSPRTTPRWPSSGGRIGASARTLSRLFHDELGTTFYEWRTQLRIFHALVLLADGHDTTHVAHACGWANPSHFIAAFAKIIGTTPGRHRAGHQV